MSRRTIFMKRSWQIWSEFSTSFRQSCPCTFKFGLCGERPLERQSPNLKTDKKAICPHSCLHLWPELNLGGAGQDEDEKHLESKNNARSNGFKTACSLARTKISWCWHCKHWTSTFLSNPPNMQILCQNYQNMHKSAKLCIKNQKCISGKILPGLKSKIKPSSFS